MASVRLENITKVFKGPAVVKDLNLNVAEGEFLVLLGPSGCGKTTTLRMVAGVEIPTSGNVYIGDRLVNDVPPRERDIAMVFQTYALYPQMTVHDNLAFPLKMRKYSKSEIEDRVNKAAATLEITELLKRRPKELSGGQRQRVALGRAIVRNPKVFLMDEPLSNLDAKLRVQTRVELKNLQKRLGTTTIYVTHDQAEAMTLADRVAVMKEGIIQQVAPPTEVYAHPVNKFVAGFIGSPTMNFLEGEIRLNQEGITIDCSDFTFPLDPTFSGALAGYSGKKVTYGIRAEDVRVSTDKTEGAVEVSVFGSELMGSEQFVHGRRGDKTIVARAPMSFSAGIGSNVWMNLTSPNAHVFDSLTEQTIA
ncbi:MAG: sn-glycerol-3-phosphate ABC transporter ATP-binding protein UgpC [Thaumarchaeota archaeon]|nr:sn-glycerol-3-phosphate ABC transporter ATP-binding protein UgpC [Nitrososphaerota archaeon]MDG6906637.1 sn-glycerol-3-phosphate ABC transporter ATP-binding protein UgpC [Nitrososphaerota archaeon]